MNEITINNGGGMNIERFHMTSGGHIGVPKQ